MPRKLRWESSFSLVPYLKQYIFHTPLTQNAKIRSHKLHMHTSTHARTLARTQTRTHTYNFKDTHEDVIIFLRVLWRENKCVSPNPVFLQEWFLWSHEERHLLLTIFFLSLSHLWSFRKCYENMSARWKALWSSTLVKNEGRKQMRRAGLSYS